MTPLPPPQGMSEADYETIEAAVTETVRGRWFLGEFARRNRAGEMRQILEAVSRLEGAVANGQTAQVSPPSDPSIRLMMQRIKEISGHLEALSGEMRDAGIEPRLVDSIAHQARAVAGMMRGPARVAPPQPAPVSATPAGEPRLSPPARPPTTPPMPRADLPPALSRPIVPREAAAVATTRQAAAAGALSALDGLAFAQKLALFS